MSRTVQVGCGLLKDLPSQIARRFPGKHVVVITDRTVQSLYGRCLPKATWIVIPPGESSKSHAMKQRIERRMFEAGCGRDTVIVALGGGVVGDLAGYVAATYMRGIPYVQVPTTVLAMVDSSVGGKTGINTNFGKNLIGAFWHPELVLADTDCLKTLPRRHMIAGLVEVVKMALTHDARLFSQIEQHLLEYLNADPRVMPALIRQALKIKMGVVARDERESGERMALNFGHTMGHAIEKVSRYKMLHGIAVGNGILLAAKLSVRLKLLSEAEFLRIARLLSRLGITGQAFQKYSSKALLNSATLDKKARARKLRYVLLDKIGRYHRHHGDTVRAVESGMVLSVLQSFAGR